MQEHRLNGRGNDQLRQLRIEQGVLVQADGSARVSLGSSCCLAAVYGPAESLARDELVEKAAIEVLLNDENRESEESLGRIVDAVCLSTLHPRTAIRIVLQRIGQDDGSMFSVIVNACCLALMDAGVQLSSLFIGVTCAVAKNGALLIDPSKLEEDDAVGVVDLVFDKDQGVIASRCRGKFKSSDEYFKCVDLGSRMCAPLTAFIRKATESRFVKKQ